MIDEPGHPTGDLRDPLEEETTMLKTISAALLAVSVLAAPALAATAAKTTPAPVSKTSAGSAEQDRRQSAGHQGRSVEVASA